MVIQKIKKILVLLDGSQNSFRALNQAIVLARAYQTKITGLYVVSYYTFGFQPFATISVATPIVRILEKEGKEFMKRAKIRCAQNGIQFSSEIIHGPEGSTIVSYIKKNDFDLVVVGSRGRSSAKEVFLGSVSNYVLHRVSAPVLIVKP